MDKTILGLLCGLGAASIWGGMYVVSKVVLDIIPPFTLVTLRLLLGIATLALFLLIKGFPGITGRQTLRVFGVGFVGYGVSLSLQFWGTKLSTAANGSLDTSATPAFVLLFAWLLLGEQITGRRLLALFLATLGVLAVIDPRSAQGAYSGQPSVPSPWRTDTLWKPSASRRPRAVSATSHGARW